MHYSEPVCVCVRYRQVCVSNLDQESLDNCITNLTYFRNRHLCSYFTILTTAEVRHKRQNKVLLCDIVRFRRGWTELFRFMGYYAEWGGLKPTFRDHLSVPSSTVKLSTEEFVLLPFSFTKPCLNRLSQLFCSDVAGCRCVSVATFTVKTLTKLLGLLYPQDVGTMILRHVADRLSSLRESSARAQADATSRQMCSRSSTGAMGTRDVTSCALVPSGVYVVVHGEKTCYTLHRNISATVDVNRWLTCIWNDKEYLLCAFESLAELSPTIAKTAHSLQYGFREPLRLQNTENVWAVPSYSIMHVMCVGCFILYGTTSFRTNNR